MSWGVENLGVSYGGKVGLEGVTLDLPTGEVTAVVGGDGAGKTTLLRVLAGLLLPSRGAARLPDRARVGYLPARAGGFRDLTVAENLEFVASVCRLRAAKPRAAALLDRTGLAPFGDRLARDLSGGMRQKLGVIMALLPEPALLILDEPTTGIDPASRADLWHLIALAASGGAAVALSSAYLDEAERASWVLVLHDGRPLLAGPPQQVTASLRGSVVEVDTPADRSRAWRRGPRWREWRPDGDPAGVPPGLEDVVIAAALAAAEGGQR